MKRTLLFSLLAVAGVSVAQAQNRPTTLPDKADTTKRMPGAISGVKKTEPKPYASVITSKAISRKGMITTHTLDDKFFFEIADSTLGRDILVVNRILKLVQKLDRLLDMQVTKSEAVLFDLKKAQTTGSSCAKYPLGPTVRIVQPLCISR